MPDLRKALKTVTEKAKVVVYPDKVKLREQWDRKLQQDKVNQIRKK